MPLRLRQESDEIVPVGDIPLEILEFRTKFGNGFRNQLGHVTTGVKLFDHQRADDEFDLVEVQVAAENQVCRFEAPA